MKATVNESCIGCGACVDICPMVFSLGEDGIAHGREVPDSEKHTAQDARDTCPVSAISLED